jgi:hypothetical protein
VIDSDQPVSNFNASGMASDGEPESPLENSVEIEALRQHMMRSWWWVCLGLWLTVGLLSLWWIRSDLRLLREYFTWATVRYTLAYARFAAIGLGLCFGTTLALLYAESRHILVGLSRTEKRQLRDRLTQIHHQGPSHPLWKVISPQSAPPQ